MIQLIPPEEVISTSIWKEIRSAYRYEMKKFTTYKAEWANKMVDFVDPIWTSQICSKCGKFVLRNAKALGRTSGEIFKCPNCGLYINVHVNTAINIRNRNTSRLAGCLQGG